MGIFLVPQGGVVVRQDFQCSHADLLQLLQPYRNFQSPQFVTEDEKLLRLFRLSLQGADLELQFVDFVLDAHQVFFGAVQLALCLLLAVAEAGDARCLFKYLPAVGGFDRQNFVDLALADVGIALPAQTGVHEQLVDVPEAGGVAVDKVFALSRAVIPPGDHDLGLFQIKKVALIIQHKRDLREAHALALLGAVKNNVFHLGTPQGLGGLLPHDPADGVGDIGLSRAIGADDSGNILAKGEDGFFREGLKSLDFQRF